jgi:hypothetical protein
MDIHLEPESPLTDLTNEELVDLLEEQYFTLVTTGSEVLDIVLYELEQGVYLNTHGISEERMMWVVASLARRLAPAWNIPAMDYYKQVNSK